MQAVRSRVACIARQSRLTGLRQTRFYASGGDPGHGDHGHDHHHHAHNVEEPIGNFFWATVAIIPAAYVMYKVATPGKDGEAPYLTKKIHEYWHWQDTWLERNALHTKAVEQAGFDRLLFFSTEANRDVDLRFPEAISNHAARNIVAGSQANLDHVIAHYKKQHLDEEARKAALLAKKQE